MNILSEPQLDRWVRDNPDVAPDLFVELIFRLVAASCPGPHSRHFPLDVNQPGPDGELDTDTGYLPFIPIGRTIWEIGTNDDARKKANDDYRKSTTQLEEDLRKKATFIFVSPLSGKRAWKPTKKEKDINGWVLQKKNNNEWKDVKVLNGSDIIDWLSHFPCVSHWFLCKMGNMPADFDTAENRWETIRRYGHPPNTLNPSLFTSCRENSNVMLEKLIIDKSTSQLRIDTRYPTQVPDYVSAFCSTFRNQDDRDQVKRILILPDEVNWRKACSLSESHILIPEFSLDSDSGSHLIRSALNRRHAVIFAGALGGEPHENSINLIQPRAKEMEQALIDSGYGEQAARSLTNKAGHDLNALIRLINNMSALPDWATQSIKGDLAIALLLGSWQERCEGDQKIIEELSGKPYGEWIAKIREAANVHSAPLEYYKGRWKFVGRYEPWCYLGPLIGQEILERFEQLALKILSEQDPSLELDKEKRYAVSLYGRARVYSQFLRKGIAETLALLGSKGEALRSCPTHLPEQVASSVVRVLLTDANASRWASLNGVLPLLSEASPDSFLAAVGKSCEGPDEPFSGVFAEEGGPYMGGTYICGLLWALELLAWSPDFLVQSCVTLGNLDAIDPGGAWGNRPIESLRNIMLPWLPQTCANTDTRHAAINTIARENPETAWKLLLSLLPKSGDISTHTHCPVWREFIPENWERGISQSTYREDVLFYAELSLHLAAEKPSKLVDLLPSYYNLDDAYREKYRNLLISSPILEQPEHVREKIWSAITTMVSKYRKYADSDAWKRNGGSLEELEEVAKQLAPKAPETIHRRWFAENDHDLYEEKGSWEEQREILFDKRIGAVKEIFDNSGFPGLCIFACSVKLPNEVGRSFGAANYSASDRLVLPSLLDSKEQSLVLFASSYIWKRFQDGQWEWVDSMDKSQWTTTAKSLFFSTLPFVQKVWDRVGNCMGDSEIEYWKVTRAFPEKGNLNGIELALYKLLAVDRVDAVVQCMRFAKLRGPSFSEIGVRALEKFHNETKMDVYPISEVIEQLQKDQTVDRDKLIMLELKFLNLLVTPSKYRPKTIALRLAKDPKFFCQFIRYAYKPEKGKKDTIGETKEKGNIQLLAKQCWKILNDWDHPPGLNVDGTFDCRELNKWLNSAKKECIKTGHWKSASSQIGRVLFFVPHPERELWPECVCEILNVKEYDEMREGLWSKIFGSRGVYTYTEGKEELVLAEKWESLAKQSFEKSFHRLGMTIRSIATYYRNESQESVEDHRHRFD